MFGVEIACETTGKHRYFVKNPEDLENNFEREWLLKSYSIPDQFSTFRMMGDCVLLEKMGRGTQYVDYLLTAIRFRRVIKLEYQPYLKASVQFKFSPMPSKPTGSNGMLLAVKAIAKRLFVSAWTALSPEDSLSLKKSLSDQRTLTCKNTLPML